MNPIVKNVLAVVVGLFVGGLVNMGLIMLGPSIISPPEGVDPSDMESLKANIHLFQPRHLIFPFLAHALGTLVGAFTAVKIGVSNHKVLAMIIGAVFLFGGIQMVMAIPSPAWFNALDLIMAYFPMAYIGHRLAA